MKHKKKVVSVARNPLVQSFVRRAVLNMAAKNISFEQRHVVHTDLVPRFSEAVVEEHLERGPQVYREIEAKRQEQAQTLEQPVAVKPIVPQPLPVSPIEKLTSQKIMTPQVSKQVNIPDQPAPKIVSPAPSLLAHNDSFGKYGKITPLLSDPGVLAVECSGSDAPVSVFLFGGQRQTTKIKLSADEIKDILTTFSDDAHVPLMEGVFRVVVDGMSVNAVISELIGSKFMIKKGQ